MLRQKEEAPAGEPNRQFIRGLAFDATGAFLVAGCDDKAQGMALWDATSWEQLQTVYVCSAPSSSAACPLISTSIPFWFLLSVYM